MLRNIYLISHHIQWKKIKFNQSVIDFITNNREKYTYTILISGSYYKYVDAISKYLGLFDFSAGTTLETNMISLNKTRYLEDKFGDLIFDYIGDSKKDIPYLGICKNSICCQ